MTDDGRQVMAKARIAFVIQHMSTFKKIELYYYIKDYPQEEFEDTKGVFRILISKKNRQHND
jgi:hypothetical protein